MKVDAPLSISSCSEAERVACLMVLAPAEIGDKGLVAEPTGERGFVGGLSETVAFGRDAV